MAVLAPVLVVTTGPAAHAGSSASGILANAWIITELGGEALSTQAELSPYEKGLATTATTGTVATTGLRSVPKAGPLGMVLNTVGVLGGLAFAFGGDDEEPTLPMPTGSTGGSIGSSACGFLTGGMGAQSTCSVVNSAPNQTNRNTIAWRNPYAYGYGFGGKPYVSYLVVNSVITGSTTSVPASGDSAAGVNRFTFSKTDAAGSTVPVAVTGQTSTGVNVPFTIWVAPGISTAGGYSGDMRLDVTQAVKVGDITVPKFGATATDPSIPTDPAAVPRYIESTITCKGGPGGTQTISRSDGPFYIAPGAPWSTPEVPDMTCPDGTWLAGGTRDLVTEGTEETLPLQEPYVAPPWVEEQFTAFPECYPATTTRCVLAVYRIAPAPAIDCGAYTIGSEHPCAAWWKDPQRSTHYECRFGERKVAMRRCSPYADTFSVGTVAPSDPDPDSEIEDPVSGTDPTPEQTPELGDCVPNWGLELLNPWWVFKAQACALAWAFVPSDTALADGYSGVADIVSNSTLTSWRDLVTGSFVMPDGEGGCLGPPVSWEYFDRMGVPNPWYPASACEEPVATAAQWSRLVLTALVGVGGVLKIAQMLAVSMGVSKSEDSISLNGGK